MAAGMKSFGSKLAGIGAGIAGGGLALLGPLVALGTNAAKTGADITDMAARLGATTDEVQALSFATIKAGGTIEDLETAAGKMQQKLAGTPLANGTLTEQVKYFADEIAALPNAAEQAAAAMEIFGKGGRKLLPFLREGSAGIDRMFKDANARGAVISAKDVAALDAADDALEDIWMVVKSLGVSVGKAFIGGADGIKSFSEFVINAGKQVREFIERNSGLIQIIGGVGAVLVTVGGAMAGLGAVIAAIGAGVAGLISLWGVVSAVFAAIVSPIGLVVVGLTAAAAATLHLLYCFTSLGGIIDTTFGGIVAAIKKGDITLAMDILWLGIKLTWQTGVAWLEEIWINFKYFFIDTFREAVGEANNLIAGTKLGGLLGAVAVDLQGARSTDEAARQAEIAAANAKANATRAELDAAVARANATEKKVEEKAKEAARLGAVAPLLGGSVKGGFFNSAFGQAVSIGDDRTVRNIEKNTAETAAALKGAGPLVWGV